MPGLFDDVAIGRLSLKNRIVVSPMCQYMAGGDGKATTWHMVHYGSFVLGGPGLVMVEATAVEARGRISVHDLGIYDDAHVEPLRGITEFIHQQGGKIGVQLAHAGRKAVVDEPIVAPSAIPFDDRYATPVAMTAEDMEKVQNAFELAAERAVQAGFDLIEVHAAHGYLLHEFLSPMSNHRQDEYGGSNENRLRFVRQVIRRTIAAVAGKIPVIVRISASEYSAGGYSFEDVLHFCQELVQEGVAAIDVSSGGNVPTPPSAYPGYQAPFAEAIKKTLQVPVIAVGMLDQPMLAEHLVQSGKVDLVAIGRGFLRDKHWAHSSALALGKPMQVPESYRRGYL